MPAKLNIGYLSFRIAGTDGVSLEAQRWRTILQRMGHKVTFIAGELDQSGLLIPELHFTHPKVYKIHEMVISNNVSYLKVEKEIFSLAGQIEGLLRESFRRFKFDSLVVSNIFSLPIHFPLAVALDRVIDEFKIPTISRNHDFWWERERYLKSHCFEFFIRFFPPRSPYIKHVAINSIAQRELKKRTGIGSTVIPDCFDFKSKLNKLDSFSKHFKKDFNIKSSDLIFLQATRIVERKNIEASIELIKRLKNTGIVLVLAGYDGDESGDYLKMIKNLAKKAQIATKFIGSRIKSERGMSEDGARFYTLWDAFINCDFVTYPSIFEGFGNQFIEAVYFKKPILINRYSVFKQDLEPLGFDVVKINNGQITDQSVEEVRKLLHNPQRIEEMVNKNFKIGSKYFSYKSITKKIEDLQNKLSI
ncbi:glycosyltransferase family 4 protein [Candidatus Daviesbacteria bacterium]|nr:glycosyltransferase family 4 protein [Candidatus Daviesbacteria bacterium]